MYSRPLWRSRVAAVLLAAFGSVGFTVPVAMAATAGLTSAPDPIGATFRAGADALHAAVDVQWDQIALADSGGSGSAELITLDGVSVPCLTPPTGPAPTASGGTGPGGNRTQVWTMSCGPIGEGVYLDQTPSTANIARIMIVADTAADETHEFFNGLNQISVAPGGRTTNGLDLIGVTFRESVADASGNRVDEALFKFSSPIEALNAPDKMGITPATGGGDSMIVDSSGPYPGDEPVVTADGEVLVYFLAGTLAQVTQVFANGEAVSAVGGLLNLPGQVAAGQPPVNPGPSNPGPSNPEPSNPGPSNPGPSNPEPSNPGPVDPTTTNPPPNTAWKGYWSGATDGTIVSYGAAHHHGDPSSAPLNNPIVGMAATPAGKGYWAVASDGGIFAFGDAKFYGSTGAIKLNQPIVGMAATPDGKGYWLVARDGGIFTFGDAQFFGSTGGIKLNQPIVGMAAKPSGRGYWLVARDGGVFTFGKARYFGSTGGIRLNKPISGMASTPDGDGYWMVAEDGGIFTFGAAKFFGSTTTPAGRRVVGMTTTPSGQGYRLAASDGAVYAFGDAPALAANGAGASGKSIVAIVS